VLGGGADVDGGAVVVLTVLVALVAGLLVPAGVAKLRDPSVAREALGLPRGSQPLVRILGAGELLLAALVLLTGGRLFVAVLAVTYAVFTAVALRQRSRGESCGCFGASQSPTGWHHVLLDGGAALTAGIAAAVGIAPVAALFVGAPLGGVPLALGAVVAIAALQLSTTALPDLAVARRTAGGSS
jgi:hypothetical protein